METYVGAIILFGSAVPANLCSQAVFFSRDKLVDPLNDDFFQTRKRGNRFQAKQTN